MGNIAGLVKFMVAKEPSPPTHLMVIVTPDFNFSATMGFVDPFRAANYLDGRAHFRWTFASDAGGVVRASNGGSLATLALADLQDDPSEFVIVSSSWAPESHATASLLSALRRADRRGATIGGLDTGAMLIAQAGLLSGYSATVHYEHIDAFQEMFPKTDVQEALWVFDGLRISCCGGVAATEFGLHILRGIHGSALANAAARYIFAPRLRDHNALQNPQDLEPVGVTVPDAVRAVILLMERNLETPLPIAEICRISGISHRKLDRLFSRYLRKTPALYYRDIRLDRARGFVTQTGMPMSEIAIACGFSSQVHFSRAYRDRFGLAPTKDRIEGRIPFEYRAWPMHRKTEKDP